MIDLPTPSNCPFISDGICTAHPPKKCCEMPGEECASIRSAYFYGYNVASKEATKDLKKVVDVLNNVLKNIGYENSDEEDPAVDGSLEDWTAEEESRFD